MIGASPRKPATGIFAGLGDLPGMQDVRADIPLHVLSIDLRFSSPLPAREPEPLADTDDRKVLRLPPSRLEQPVPQSLAFSRALGQRPVRAGQCKRKAESGFQLTHAFHAFDLLRDDHSNLRSLVRGIACGADDLGDDAAESVGRNLVRRLGGTGMRTADRDLVVDTVMEVALARPESADALGALLRGMGHVLGGALGACDQALVDEAFHQAACRSIDPVMCQPQQPPSRSQFQAARGPMRVAVSLLRGSAQAPLHLERQVRALLARVAAHPPHQMTDDDLKRGAFALEALRFSLGEALDDPKTAEALITAVALHISECNFNPKALGWALGRMLGAGQDPQRDARHVVSALGQRWLGERRLGYLVWGILGADLPTSLAVSPSAGESAAGVDKAGVTPVDGAALQSPVPAGPSHGVRTLQRLLDLGERLAPRHLGRVVYSLALTTGEARHWGPQCPVVPSDVVGAVLQACGKLGDAHVVALLAGLQAALRRLSQGNPAFEIDGARLRGIACGREASHALTNGLALVFQPALALVHPGLAARHRIELLDLALNFGAAQSQSLVAALATRLLAEDTDPALRVPGLGRLVVRAMAQVPRQHLPAIRARLTDYVQRLDRAATQARDAGRTGEVAQVTSDAAEARRWLEIVAEAAGPAEPADSKQGSRKPGGR